jgi:hypothetical protein
MKTDKELKQKTKEFETWARNDAKHYVIKGEEYMGETIAEYQDRTSSVYTVERLTSHFGWSVEQAEYLREIYNTSFWRGYEYWQKEKAKDDVILSQYKQVFKEAEDIGNETDTSEIVDGFPVGGGIIFLKEGTNKSLEKVLKRINDSDSYCWRTKLPIRVKQEGQCVELFKKPARAIVEYLKSKGIEADVYSYID